MIAEYPYPTLETSLVEWKRGLFLNFVLFISSLGNFLSGMETGFTSFRYDALKPALETSLVEWKLFSSDMMKTDSGTLETSLVEWKRFGTGGLSLYPLPLETSLVEWKPSSLMRRSSCENSLGNFLSGMETSTGRKR